MHYAPKSIHETTKLYNGVEMPWLGLGVYKIDQPATLTGAIEAAFKAGYRRIDTASVYENEQGVGQAIRRLGIGRDSIFITSKLWNDHQKEGYDASMQAFEDSLERLGMDYLDLYLIHWPQNGYSVTAWKALIKLLQDGRIRAIGVSNFSPAQIDELAEATGILPAVNQIERHPWRRQQPLIDYCRSKGIQVEAYSPLMRGRFHELSELAAIAARHDKTMAQIILRWDLQTGVAVIPKSSHAERIRENADIFDFELSPTELEAINALDQDRSILGPPPVNEPSS